MMAILTKYWRPLAIIIIVAICALWVVSKVSSYGESRDANDRYLRKGRSRTKATADEQRQRRNAELQKIQADASKRIDAARSDAVNATSKSWQVAATAREISAGGSSGYFTSQVRCSDSARGTGVLLSDVLSKSVEKETDSWQITP